MYKANAEHISLRVAATIFFAIFKANAAFIFRFVMQILALLNIIIAFVFMLISAGITLKMPCEAAIANN